MKRKNQAVLSSVPPECKELSENTKNEMKRKFKKKGGQMKKYEKSKKRKKEKKRPSKGYLPKNQKKRKKKKRPSKGYLPRLLKTCFFFQKCDN